jgi:hypothetical protein
VLAPRVPREFDHDAEAAIADEQKARLLGNAYGEVAELTEAEVRAFVAGQVSRLLH